MRLTWITIVIGFLIKIVPIYGQVKINEIVSSNSSFYDEDGDSPDWIELKNFGSDSDLNGWFISDDRDILTKWKINSLTLNSEEINLIWASGKDQSIKGLPQSILDLEDEYKWIIPNATTSSDWRNINFDDNNWQTGLPGFGYGDSDDTTILPAGTTSIFLRKTFIIEDTSNIFSLILHMDYDDAFVAYLNGLEIARANIEGYPPAYNAAPPSDHEASMYLGGSPDVFFIENFKEAIVEGYNVLAIQGHNVNLTSSDFTIIPFLSAYVGTNNGNYPDEILGIADLNMHTNFKISDGETVYLSNEQAEIVDSIKIDSIPVGASIGLLLGGNEIAYFEIPTPGVENNNTGYHGILESQIQFSHEGGISDPLSLQLITEEQDAVIRYTLDANIPNINSPTYLNPIEINSNTVVRARIFKEGFLPTSVQSRSYVINGDHDLPIVTLVTEPDNFFDPVNGLYVLGQFYTGQYPFFGSNIWEDWERPIQVSFYEQSGVLGTSFNAGTKVFGGWSRANDQRSLSIFARKKYGTDEISYPLFKGLEYNKFQALVLRNSGNDWLRSNLRDGILTGLLAGADMEVQAFRPVVTYLNAQYWGIYNLREKINEHFLASKFDVDPDDINLLELNGITVHGSNGEYLELLDFLNSYSLQNEENYNYISRKIDIDNYILYQLSQIYFDNRDWPGNNIKFWNTNGGKWRWILFDIDFGFGIWEANSYTFNTLAFALSSTGPDWPNPPWSTLLFRKLVQNNSFKYKFINQFADELNTRFLPAKVREHIDTITAVVNSEMTDHFLRWNSNPSSWSNEIVRLKNFAGQRHGSVKQHILSSFQLTQFHAISIQNETPDKGYVKLNSLTLESEQWTGDYFQDVPITITAIPYPGYKFSHWTGGSVSSNAQIVVNPTGAETFIPIFEAFEGELENLVINEINYNSDKDFDTGDWVEIYNPNSASINISEWELRDSKDREPFLFEEGTFIPGQSFLLVCREKNKFQGIYPNLEYVFGDMKFGLGSDMDTVRFFNDKGKLIDFVAFSSSDPWPEEANGYGATLELISPELDNSLPGSWKNINDFGSPGRENIKEDVGGENEVIENLKVYPNPFYDEIFVTFVINRPSIFEARLYSIDGSKVATIFNDPLGAGTYIINKNLSYLSSGVYILEILIERKRINLLKWVKI